MSIRIPLAWIGSIGHVHLSCLERWLNECGVGMCELCQFQFNVDRTLRYTAWRSLWIWIRCPNHQSALCADFMVMIIMTLVISILVTSMIWGYQILPNDTTTIAKYAMLYIKLKQITKGITRARF